MTPEFSRPVRLERIPAGGLDVSVTAEAPELAALAKRFGLAAISALSCRFHLRPVAGGAVEAAGELAARLTQVCVVSLDPFEVEMTEKFRLRFVPEGAESDDPDPEAVDEVPFPGDVLDLGEAASEQLALALDPYPRKPGATLAGATTAERENPFAALARLRTRQ